jgi:folylpolyglutamate synthase/dihydropteroate synthase
MCIAKKYCDDVVAIDNPVDAVNQKDVTLICGSFYLIRDIINLI